MLNDKRNYLIPKELIRSIPTICIFLFSTLAFTVFCEDVTEPFSIGVSLNYLEVDLQYVSGGRYLAWWIFDAVPGDTIGMTDEVAVHLLNGSNVMVDILGAVYDHPDSGTSDTLWTRWKVGSVGSVDTMGFRFASYPVIYGADIRDAVTILSTPVLIESGLPVGEDRFLYAWLILPTEGVEGEHHRLLSTITLIPSVAPPFR